MKLRNFNYDIAVRVFGLAREEFLKAPDILDRQMAAFSELAGTLMRLEQRKLYYGLGAEPSFFLRNTYSDGNNVFTFDLPAIDTDGTILMYGHRYFPVIEVSGKPVFRTKKSIHLQTALIDVSFYGANVFLHGAGKARKASVYFEYALGRKRVEDVTGIRYMDDGIDFTDIKPNFDTKEFREAFGGYSRKEYDEMENTIESYLYKWLELVVPKLDLFTAQYLEEGSPALTVLKSMAKYNDGSPVLPAISSLASARLRIYERFMYPITCFLAQKIRDCITRKGPAIGNKTITMANCTRSVLRDRAVVNAMGFTNMDKDNALMLLTNTTRLSKTVRYGKKAVRGKARNIDNSQYGTICPITTPERESCGIVEYLAMSNRNYFNNIYRWPTNK